MCGLPQPVVEAHVVPRWLSHYDSLVQGASALGQFERAHIPGNTHSTSFAT